MIKIVPDGIIAHGRLNEIIFWRMRPWRSKRVTMDENSWFPLTEYL